MKTSRLVGIYLLLGPVWASDAPPGAGMPPPPLDTTACQGKSVGAEVQITTPDGRNMKASCVLVALPARPAGPPPTERPPH